MGISRQLAQQVGLGQLARPLSTTSARPALTEQQEGQVAAMADMLGKLEESVDKVVSDLRLIRATLTAQGLLPSNGSLFDIPAVAAAIQLERDRADAVITNLRHVLGPWLQSYERSIAPRPATQLPTPFIITSSTTTAKTP